MIVELGHFALTLAFALSLVQFVLPLWGALANDEPLMNVAAPAALGTFVAVGFAFLALTYAYVTSDFSVLNVVENSHTLKPMLYKITGVWGNHEGSMLLWIFILVLFAALVAMARHSLPLRLKALTLSFQALIASAFLLFLLASSNPFARISPAPFEGQDLNPILQDIGLAIHPPLLYIGYVGISITFSFAAAALVEGRIDALWARAVRPWTLTAWVFLTLGIAMGSYWAYYELGWGGWWFWDPVENASFMPWLAATALLHSTVVMEKRDALKVWTILLAIVSFSLSLLGTFLVRSGVLTSVHTFATDPARGAFILGILIFFIGGAFALFAWRAPLLRQGGIFAPVSREGALVLNNLFLATACATVFIGTLYPLALESLTGEKISVGEPYFEATFLPIMLPLLFIIPVGQTLAWKRGDLLGAAQRLMGAFALAIAVALAVIAITEGGPVLAVVSIGLGFFIIFGSLSDTLTRCWPKGAQLGVVWRRAVGLPRSAWGTTLAHAGVGVVVIGIAASAWSTEDIALVKPGGTVQTGPYTLRLDGVFPRAANNYREDVARFTLSRHGRDLGTMEASKRLYTTRGMPTTEAGIRTIGLGQLYVSLGDNEAEGAIGLRAYWKPYVTLIWLGSIIMAAGGALSLTDRRIRVGVPRRRLDVAAVPAE
ncbi:MAG: heme lyase CcmF/NrfE family subunit [Chelatococcus sp.]|jgi:cytochrome c-type biogenesis protein CcmF|uniref:heme lyase CcmF/NrfE family subunit n=1 Tax=unclassified Chelatococcus TaxID=2638111 RepID=UPI001BD0B641|nr:MULTISPECIES: heme lyase CcmF/NrfE family subunit [unclassified Chelatococcus]CAH1669663.1 holocytochrome c synthase CcmF component [Hyphomicrobiales bacterium]MBS7739305.1 heme lyase CcmF/NrfE family subunit [Chelatococcus sp. HY11]MBX3537404.1 heme lyase CcmF/NrfE family subunit [Chelatococcus sp.]MBX3546584.1 heme lyase CcmF/NrfE family subunit [Chelatococcus sp.]MCO5076161.1 heme lyase CcmF/NrfE family subunit [Chelatococcus sp.]